MSEIDATSLFERGLAERQDSTQLGNSEGPLVGRYLALAFSTSLIPFRSTLALFAEQRLR